MNAINMLSKALAPRLFSCQLLYVSQSWCVLQTKVVVIIITHCEAPWECVFIDQIGTRVPEASYRGQQAFWLPVCCLSAGDLRATDDTDRARSAVCPLLWLLIDCFELCCC